MAAVQIVLAIFLIFALSRVVLRFRDRKLSPLEFIFWAFLFIAAIIGVSFPDQTTRIAKMVGIGRGVDLVIYGSIVVLFYLVFRIYVMMEGLHHEITELIRKIALNQPGSNKSSSRRSTKK